MKPQDIIFFVVLIILLILRRPKWFGIAGLLCLLFAIPLFAKHVFFTAEHLVYYAAGFFLTTTILLLVHTSHENSH